MTVDEEKQWMAEVRLEAEGGGNHRFYDELLRKVELRKARCTLAEYGGDFSPAELTNLIQSIYDLQRHIETLRPRETPLHG